MGSQVKTDKTRIKGNNKKRIIAVSLAVIMVLICAFTVLFINSLRLDFDKKISKANNDIRYIMTMYVDDGEERYFFVSEDMLSDFIKDMPQINYVPSAKYIVSDLFNLYAKEKLEASIMVVCNVRDEGILNKNSIGLEYKFLRFGDEVICSFVSNHNDFESFMTNKYKVDSLEIIEYIKNYADKNTEKLTKENLLKIINKKIECKGMLQIEDFGKYEYRSIVGDSGHKFGLTGIATGGKDRMTIEIDEVYDLYVYFSKESYTNMEDDEYFFEVKTKGIILYNKTTEEYVDLMKDIDKAQSFLK